MQQIQRWTEDQLVKDIAGLNHRIAEADDRVDSDLRCVCSYLKQLVRDKRDKLATLRYQRRLAS